MKFGKLIRLEANLGWNDKWVDYYLDYKGLKQLLKKHLNEEGHIENFAAFKEALLPTWKREVLKIDSFLKRECKRLDQLITTERESLSNEGFSQLLIRRQLNIKRLQKFCHVNYEGLRKYLKKVMKHCSSTCEDGKAWATNQTAKIFGANSERDHAIENLRAKIEEISGKPVMQEFDPKEAEDIMNKVELEEDVPTVKELVLESLPPGKISKLKLAIQPDEMGEFISIPIIIAKGQFNGPTLGLTSALHGNELNGIPMIFRLFREVDVETLSGTLVAIPVLNPPGYSRRQRNFFDGQDLNRLFPGKPKGNCGQVYVHNIMEKLVKKFDYHIDLHTASFGRVNSLYVRANMLNPITHTMAVLQHPQIIVHNTAPDGSLRSAAMALGIPSITVEIGDPLQFHNEYILRTLSGVENVMAWLNMQSFDEDEKRPNSPKKKMAPHSASSRVWSNSVETVTGTNYPAVDEKTTVCARSKWLYAAHGGILRVKPAVNTWVEKGQVIAHVQDLFGNIKYTYRAEVDGIVVGKSTNPICSTGDRILHLGYVEAEFPEQADDGHT